MSDTAFAAGPSGGVLLRQAREAAGLHVAALAASLKVPVRKLEALEEDRYEQLTDAVFARALALSVCRTLKIDPQPILDRLPQTTAPRLVQDHEGIGAPFRAPGDAAAPVWRDYVKSPVTLAVGGLLLGAIAILLLPSFRSEAPAAAVRTETTEVPMAASVVLPATVSDGGTPAANTSPSAPAVPTAAPVAVSTTPALAAAPAVTVTTVSTVASPASAPAAATPVNVAPAATGIVVFKVSGPSWIEVMDSQGKVPLRRLLAAGESAGASGALPLAVTVGSVSTTTVEVRGKPFDLGRVSRDNVARFEIK
ncbi:helix-turn-helix domain-containing protein [Ramlibacter henchirensis]|uniref:Helix-turn-helix domain-containing protein n=1 Tax=Ramlibacter henchirensis TaxID=204072 RepID=A0A4Z0BN54_9BURK|nr:helix-turn-helix domain-containing protein [Ramlibacter henchirensis]TFZ00737.1 helix-turn-helix domain-containing protein [Ramlibacter henchirensis]